MPPHPSLNPKIVRYAAHLIEKYDLNRDKVLQKDEWQSMHGRPVLIDRNGDEVITLDELSSWVDDYSDRKRAGIQFEPEPMSENTVATSSSSAETERPSETTVVTEGSQLTMGSRRRDQQFYVPDKRLPAGLPDWFFAKDQDGDGQLTAAEFSPTNAAAELTEFATYDANRDGVVTAKECVGKGAKKPDVSAKGAGDPLPSEGSNKPARSRRKQRTNQ